MKRLIAGVTISFLFALCGSWIVRAQEPAKTICGTDTVAYTTNIDLLQISCVDYEALRKVAPQVPWPSGTRTQVLVHIRAGDVVKITVDGESKFSDVITDAWGRSIAMVQFDGSEHTTVSVKVYSELK